MVSFSLYQLLVPLFAALMLLKSLSQFHRKQKTAREFIAVAIFWILMSLVALFPHIFIDRVAQFLGIRSGINALFFFSFVLLFYIVFRLLIASEEQEEKTTKIIRNIALKSFENSLKNNERS
jgi:hypothetical protein